MNTTVRENLKDVNWLKVSDLQLGMQIAVCDPEISDGAVWDEIISIKNVGRERVYDIEVENSHNFVGNGILAHNTYIFGNVRADSAVFSGSGVAESYLTNDLLEAGDIVKISNDKIQMTNQIQNPNDQIMIEKASLATDPIIGVVSEKPGVLLANSTGYGGQSSVRPVALAGRVLVKVSLENGEIKIGDRIALSPTPGVGAKATSSGQTIGIALQEFSISNSQFSNDSGEIIYDKNAIGKILVFINLSQHRLALEDEPIIKNHEERISNLEEQIANLQFSISNFQSIFNASIFNASSSTATSTGDSIISQGFSWILEQFKNIGIVIAEGFIQVKNLVADVITSREIATEYLRVNQEMEIGSREKPIGITIYDKLTGEPNCVYLEGGVLKNSSGKCGAEALANTGSFSGTVNALELPPNSTTESAAGQADNNLATSSIPTLGEVGTPTESVGATTSTPDVEASEELVPAPAASQNEASLAPEERESTPEIQSPATPETISTTEPELAPEPTL